MLSKDKKKKKRKNDNWVDKEVEKAYQKLMDLHKAQVVLWQLLHNALSVSVNHGVLHDPFCPIYGSRAETLEHVFFSNVHMLGQFGYLALVVIVLV